MAEDILVTNQLRSRMGYDFRFTFSKFETEVYTNQSIINGIDRDLANIWKAFKSVIFESKMHKVSVFPYAFLPIFANIVGM